MSSAIQETTAGPTPARRGRSEGTAAGLLVAATAVVVVIVFVLATQTPRALESIEVLGPATLATGTLVGRWFGPRRTSGTRARTCLLMAATATAVGDLFVGFGLGLTGMVGTGNGPVVTVLNSIAAAFMLWPFGLVLCGLIALLITFLAAQVWWQLLGRLLPER